MVQLNKAPKLLENKIQTNNGYTPSIFQESNETRKHFPVKNFKSKIRLMVG